jgi:aspartate racemase
MEGIIVSSSREGTAPLVGILGGMGPAATADFYSKLIGATPAATDQEHLRVMVWADPSVPDRSLAITGDGEDPTPYLITGAQHLAQAGASFYVVACHGAHAFLPRVRQEVDLEYLSIIEVTADYVSSLPYAKHAGLLATDATLQSDLYQSALCKAGVTPVVPSADDQRTVMETIYAVKAGRLHPDQRAALAGVAARMVDSGADVVIAACTEIPLVITEDESPRPLIDPAQLLANRVVHESAARWEPRFPGG